MCDWSARDLQRRERGIGLGPVKGKDWATTSGPVFVTADELPADYPWLEVGDRPHLEADHLGAIDCRLVPAAPCYAAQQIATRSGLRHWASCSLC
jgi:hypothetical protein